MHSAELAKASGDGGGEGWQKGEEHLDFQCDIHLGMKGELLYIDI